MKKKNGNSVLTESISQDTKLPLNAHGISGSAIFENGYDSGTARKKKWKAFVILILGFVLTAAAVFYVQRDSDKNTKQEFASVCDEIKLKISDRLHAHALLLRSGAAFFKASNNVSREEWKVYNETAKIENNLPGIQGVGFSLIVPENQLKEHIQSIRKDGFPNYTIYPAGDREVYTSIIYLEPFSGRNLKAFGYDMYSEKVRRKAMEQSRDADVAMLTGKVLLVQETKEDIQTGTLMYVPVYRNGMPANTVAQRRAAIIGWVYSPYRMSDLMKGILGHWDINEKKRVRLQIYDDSVSAGSLLYDSQRNDSLKNKHPQNQTLSLPVDFNGKKWVLFFSRYDSQIHYFQSAAGIVLLSGLLISLLLFLLFVSLFNTRHNARQIAENLTAELRESAKQYKDLSNLFESIIDHVPGLIFYKDKKNNFIRVNKTIAQAHRKPKSEIEGKNLNELYSKEDAEKYYQDDLEVINSGVAKLNIEEHWITEDGLGWFNTSKIPFADAEGKIIGVIGMSMNITERKKIEIEREQFLKFFNISSDIMVIADPNGCFMKINPACLELLGYSEAELLAKPFIDFVHPDDRQSTLDEMANQIKTGNSMNFENRYMCKDGSSKILSWRANYVAEEGITYATARDITELKQEEEIQMARSRLLLFADKHSVDEMLEEALNEMEKITGSCIGFCHFVNSDQNSLTLKNWSTRTKKEFCKTEGKGSHYEIAKAGVWVDCFHQQKPVIHNDYDSLPHKKGMPDGHAKVTREMAVPIMRNDKVVAILGIGNKPVNYTEKDVSAFSNLADLFWNIVERKQAEDALRNANLYNRSLIEASIDPLVTIGPDGKITDVNNASVEVTGISREQLIGSNFSNYFTEPEQSNKGYLQVLSEGLVKDYPLTIKHINGKLTDVLYNAAVYKNQEGKVVGVFAAARDITEAKKMEKSLQDSSQRLQLALETNTTGVWDLDLFDHTAFRTLSHDNIFGYQTLLPEWTFEIFLEHVLPEDRADVENKFNDAVATQSEWKFDCRIRRIDGVVRWIFARGIHKLNPDGKSLKMIGIVQDITERKNNEEALVKSESNLRAIFENTAKGFLLMDNKFTVIEFNSLMGKYIAISDNVILHKNESIFIDLPAERQDFLRTRFNSALDSEKVHYEISHMFPGNTIIYFEVKMYPVLDPKEKVAGICISYEDITSRKLVEEQIFELNKDLDKKVQERTIQYELVNKELESFTFSVSHDLRAPLRAVNSYAQILEEDYGGKLDADGKQMLKNIENNGKKMGKLIDDLLAFSRLGRKELKRDNVNMNELTKAVAEELNQSFPNHAKIEISELPEVHGDYSLLYQAMLNLMSNAIKYSSKKEKPIIKVFAEEKEGKSIFSIKDNGAGFDMRYADKLFGVFQRLHSEEEFEGSGIGLAIVERIIVKHGGKVWGDGEVNEGASFYFTLI